MSVCETPMAGSVLISQTRRCVGHRHRSAWAQSRRERYLLGASQLAPLSVDTDVLPLAEPGDPAGDLLELVGTFTPGTCSSTEAELEHQFAQSHNLWRPVPQGLFRLGYDVCDPSLKSGLTNFASPPNNRESLGAYWAMVVNQFHLLQNHADARALAEKRALAAPSHAPFFVVELFLLRA